MGGGTEQHCSGCRKPLEALWRMGPERWMGEGQRRACAGRVQGCFETRSYFSLFSLPTRTLQINAQGAVCVHFLMVEAARGPEHI